jgi:hypothetical protein
MVLSCIRFFLFEVVTTDNIHLMLGQEFPCRKYAERIDVRCASLLSSYRWEL